MGDRRRQQETTGELNIQRDAKFYGKLAARGKAVYMQRHDKYLRTHTHTHKTVWPLVRDNPGRHPVPEETLTHSHPS